MPRVPWAIVLSLLLAVEASAQQPKSKLSPQQQKATDDIHLFLRRATIRLADRDLGNIKSLDDWQSQRPQLRQQLFEMLGLSPLPEKTDLKATITGTVDAGEFVVEKLHFQSRPGLYVTANFYRPKRVDKPLPTILYLCGHGTVKLDGVSYGAKASYLHHPAWYAREGYCCLILDTLQLAEIEGFHHGTNRFGWWWWVSRGYTPAGVEAWNCIRALDYLESRPEVDMTRIGVTGRSGGGAYTWWTAALDDRPACFVPVAGITDLQNHVVDHCVEGHCDCMYMVNTYGWDFATVAALAAPRPLLISNSDKDNIFPLDGVYRIHTKVKRIYDLHNAADKLGLLITEGPHKDTQDLQVPAFRWFNRFLKKSNAPITRAADAPFNARQLRVFDRLPADEKNTTIHETFTPAANVSIPETAAEWNTLRQSLTAQLRDKCFRNGLLSETDREARRRFHDGKLGQQTEELPLRVVADRTTGKLRLQCYEYESEGMTLPAFVVRGARHLKTTRLIVTPVDSAQYSQWLGYLADGFGDLLPGQGSEKSDSTANRSLAALLDSNSWTFVFVPPRGEGPNQWDPDPKKDTHIRRRLVLVGRTADDCQVMDMRRAIQSLRTLAEFKETKPELHGRGRMAGIALYAGLFEPSVQRMELTDLPASHRDGPTFLNVLRVLDMPQAVALAFPREVVIRGGDPKAWTWCTTIADRFYRDEMPLKFEAVAAEPSRK